MAERLATATRNAMITAVSAAADGGTGPATIEVRSGPQPASANLAATGTLLATFTLGDPAFGAASNGAITPAGLPLSTVGVAAGDAGWFRLQSSTPATVIDGSVTATGGGGELELNTVTISVGVDVEITASTFTMPSGE